MSAYTFLGIFIFVAEGLVVIGGIIFMGFFLPKIIRNARSSGSRRISVPDEQFEAVVVSKRTHVTSGEYGSTSYYATFQYTNDRREEFRVSGTDYGYLAEGDRGLLVIRGGRFVCFRRTDDRFDARGAAEREHKCPACGAPYTGRTCPYCGTPFERKMKA
ncbi:MAG: DUF2500 family protein [Clostridiales bacterium]|nr:DUF2500 family protein [Clostridiales bacterium]